MFLTVIVIVVVSAALIAGAAWGIYGNLLLSGVPEAPLGLIRCVAGGAVVASLGTEVFPKAFKEDGYATGAATAIGVVFAIALGQLD